MTKRERVFAALERRPVDRPPVSLWRHVPELDHDPRKLADAMLAFHRRLDLDFIKLMSSGVYCVEDWGCKVAYAGGPSGAKQCTEHAVKTTPDWVRLRPLDPGAGALGRELEALRLVVEGRDDGAPVIHTVFSPLTIARKLAGDRLSEDVRAAPDAVAAALEVITQTTARYAEAALDTGADGIFFATQAASAETFTLAEAQQFDAPYARRILERVQRRSMFTLLHIHGRDIYFDELASLPAHAVNWHDRLTRPTLAEGLARRADGAVVGGLSEGRTLRGGPSDAIAAEVRDAIQQTGGVGLILSPGCVVPLDVPEAHLAAAVEAVKRG
jgi:uroporphyrinogen decarboxylase